MIGSIGTRFLGRVAVKEGVQQSRFGGVGSTLLTGISFVGRESFSFLTNSIGTIVSLGGGILVFLLTQQRPK